MGRPGDLPAGLPRRAERIDERSGSREQCGLARISHHWRLRGRRGALHIAFIHSAALQCDQDSDLKPLAPSISVTALPGFAPDRYRDNSSVGGREKARARNARNERPESKAREAAKPVEQKTGPRTSSHRDARQVFFQTRSGR